MVYNQNIPGKFIHAFVSPAQIAEDYFLFGMHFLNNFIVQLFYPFRAIFDAGISESRLNYCPGRNSVGVKMVNNERIFKRQRDLSRLRASLKKFGFIRFEFVHIIYCSRVLAPSCWLNAHCYMLTSNSIVVFSLYKCYVTINTLLYAYFRMIFEWIIL